MSERSLADGFLLVLVGVWLLLQTLAGDLPGRILAWGRPTSSSPDGDEVAPGPTPPTPQGEPV